MWPWYAAVGALACACLALLIQNLTLRHLLAPFRSDLNPVLAAVIERERPTKIIVSDSSYSLAQDLIHDHNSLYQYIDAFPRSFLDTPPARRPERDCAPGAAPPTHLARRPEQSPST